MKKSYFSVSQSTTEKTISTSWHLTHFIRLIYFVKLLEIFSEILNIMEDNCSIWPSLLLSLKPVPEDSEAGPVLARLPSAPVLFKLDNFPTAGTKYLALLDRGSGSYQVKYWNSGFNFQKIMRIKKIGMNVFGMATNKVQLVTLANDIHLELLETFQIISKQSKPLQFFIVKTQP